MIEKGVKRVNNQEVIAPKKNPYNCEYCGWNSDPKEVKIDKGNFICESCGFDSPLPTPVSEDIVVIDDDSKPSTLNNKKVEKIQKLQMKAKTGGKLIIKKIVQTMNSSKNNIRAPLKQGNKVNNIYNFNKQTNNSYNLNMQSNKPSDLLNSLFPLRPSQGKPKQGKVPGDQKSKNNDDTICIIDDDGENEIPSEKKAGVDKENNSDKKVKDGQIRAKVAAKNEKELEDFRRTWLPVEDESFPTGWAFKQASVWGRRMKYRSPEGNEFPTRTAALNSMGKGRLVSLLENEPIQDISQKAKKMDKDNEGKKGGSGKKDASRKLKSQKGTSRLNTLEREQENTADSSRRTSTRLSAKKAMSSIRKTATEKDEDHEDEGVKVSKRTSKRISFDSDEIEIVKEVKLESPKSTKSVRKSSRGRVLKKSFETNSRRNSTGNINANVSRRASNRRHSTGAGQEENSPKLKQKSSKRVSFEGDEISIVEEVHGKSPKKPVKNSKKLEKRRSLKEKLLEKKRKTAIENRRNTPRRLSKREEKEEVRSKDDLDDIYDDISIVGDVVPKSPTPIKNKKAQKGRKGSKDRKQKERKETEKKPSQSSVVRRSSSRSVKSKNVSYTFSSDEESDNE